MTFVRNMLRMSILIAVVMGLGQQYGYSQYKEDALRLGVPGIGVGARSLGLGNAYTGVASDFSALYWNPAGLAQAKYGEFSFGLSYQANSDQSSFLGNNDKYTSSSTNLNSLGLVFPVPVRRGSMAFAFGYDREANFASGMAFQGFNPISSIIQSWAPDGGDINWNTMTNLAWDLYLIDSASNRWVSPIKNNVTQKGEATEGGGLNNWSVGGAVELAKDVNVGVTLTYIAGSYRYDRNYHELATQTQFAYPFDLKELVIDEFIDGDISGFNAKFGLLFKLPDWFRLGLAVKTPTSFGIRESYGTTGTSYFWSQGTNSGASSFGPFDNPGSDEYDVHTPWVFSGGASMVLWRLMVSADIDYTDWTQLEFTSSNSGLDIQGLNREIRDAFRGTVNLRGGAELDLYLRLRAGFMYNQSPYKSDPTSFDQKYLTAGVGLPLGESTMLDFGYAYGWWDTFRLNYDQTSRVDEKIKANNFMLTLTHRF